MSRRTFLKSGGLTLIALGSTQARAAVRALGAGKISAAGDAWREFIHSLYATLSDAEDGDFIALTDWNAGGYCAVLTAKDGGIVAQAASILRVADHNDMSKSLQDAMFKLGWHSPAEFKMGAPNWFVDVPTPIGPDQMAVLVGRTFRDVYSAETPEHIEHTKYAGLDRSQYRIG